MSLSVLFCLRLGKGWGGQSQVHPWITPRAHSFPGSVQHSGGTKDPSGVACHCCGILVVQDHSKQPRIMLAAMQFQPTGISAGDQDMIICSNPKQRPEKSHWCWVSMIQSVDSKAKFCVYVCPISEDGIFLDTVLSKVQGRLGNAGLTRFRLGHHPQRVVCRTLSCTVFHCSRYGTGLHVWVVELIFSPCYLIFILCFSE